MEKQDIKPHKWAKEIIAWANGAKIERKASTILNSKWSISASPIWDRNCWEFRVYDPLREVKEAFDRGETIQGRIDNFSMWIDFSKNLTTLSFDSIKNINGWEWRIKPTDNLKEGKDYIHNDGDYLVIDRVGNFGNLGFTHNGERFDRQLICSNPENWQEVTKEEVKKYFESHLIKRYGEDWRDVKVKECLHFNYELKVNTGGFKVGIVKTFEGWKVWNKNGCLFKGGEWAEVLGEETQYAPFEEEDKEQFRGKWIKRKDGSIEMNITSFGTLSTNTFLIEGKCSKYLFENFTFLDGTPFGKIKQ